MTRAPLRKALLAIGGGGGALAAFAALVGAGSATQACTTHQCDSLSVTRGLGPDGGIVGTGEIVSRVGGDVKWESNPWVPPDGGTWLPFNGEQTYVFMFPPDAGLSADDIWSIQPYIADNSDPLDESDGAANFVNGAGQLSEIAITSPIVDGNGISITNSTCANYFLHLTIEFILPDAAPALDASPGGELEGSAAVPLDAP